jgi:hypothetical protein
MMRRMGRAGREIDEERLIGRERFLLSDPGDRLIGHVFHQVVAFFRRPLQLDGSGAFIESRVPLVGLAAEEAIEVLESAAARGPLIERSDRARLPHRHFMALSELRCGIPIELQRLCKRCDGVRQH